MAVKADTTMRWGHLLLLNGGGHLFSLVPTGLDFEIQDEILRAMEELSHETTARISEAPIPMVEV